VASFLLSDAREPSDPGSYNHSCGDQQFGESCRAHGNTGPCYLLEFGGSCFLSEAAFCCAAFVLPDDTCANATSQSIAAAKRASSILVLILDSFPDGPI
jgi:hypothetical protein